MDVFMIGHTRSFTLFLIAIFLPYITNGAVSAGTTEVDKLHALFDVHWERDMKRYPDWASKLGNRRFNQNWQNLSPEAFVESTANDQRALSSLSEINRSVLSDQEKVNYDLFKLGYEDRIRLQKFSPHLLPINQRGGIQSLDQTADFIPLESVSDYDDWLVRLSKIEGLMEQTIQLMASGIKQGIVPPKATMIRIPAQIEKQIVKDPTKSLFYKPFKELPEKFSEADVARLQQDAQSIIRSKIVPAYEKLYDYFNQTYYPACRDNIGISEIPNGREYYENLVKSFTTTEMTPDEVYELGLKEVKRIRQEMESAITESGFEGDFAAFIHFLRTDPQFYYATSEELFEAYQAMSKRLDPELVHLFTVLPRMPYGVKKIPDAIAPDTTTAYYSLPAADGSRAGYYYVNLYKPETRPKFEMEVLSVHESVPGHHIQLALQQELESLPNFRRYSGFTVFIEGWGLYSERLGYEMGLYKDPYSRFGQLTYDMWRAVRLVVDTGMHYKGWSRQKAIDYFKFNAPKSELDIINEIDRYIAWPGQALAYKIGQLKILALRQEAEDRLGEHFDLRRFHDTVLGNGSVPLYVLENLVREWIDLELANPVL
ncbi:MAG: hypothetical protein ACI9CE_001637 [Flavobacterium sp.]|jgi:uncharacterized protein (DUF885 family)